jgi:hypothetical protein
MSESKIVPGWFAGTCTNTTVNQSANLLLHIFGGTDSRMYGQLGVYGNLGGGGPFHANLKERRLLFTTCQPAHQSVIEWSGDRTEDGFSGTYKVEVDAPELSPGQLRLQEGVRSCSFVRDLSAPDADEFNRVSVFHEGRTEGPFSMEEFAQHAIAERWPPYAMAAAQDCTDWSTVGAFLASLRAETISGN